jgi:hypothetical protein
LGLINCIGLANLLFSQAYVVDSSFELSMLSRRTKWQIGGERDE